MISTSMLKQQAWMADDDEVNYIVKNSQKILKLNDQYKNQPYAEEFTNSVMLCLPKEHMF